VTAPSIACQTYQAVNFICRKHAMLSFRLTRTSSTLEVRGLIYRSAVLTVIFQVSFLFTLLRQYLKLSYTWFSRGLWQWLVHYKNIVLDIVHCPRYTEFHNILGVGSTLIFKWLAQHRLAYWPSIQKVLGSMPTTVTNNNYKKVIKYVSIMTTNHLKTVVQLTPEMSCISNISQTVDSA
jgi:hypothetical protein